MAISAAHCRIYKRQSSSSGVRSGVWRAASSAGALSGADTDPRHKQQAQDGGRRRSIDDRWQAQGRSAQRSELEPLANIQQANLLEISNLDLLNIWQIIEQPQCPCPFTVLLSVSCCRNCIYKKADSSYKPAPWHHIRVHTGGMDSAPPLPVAGGRSAATRAPPPCPATPATAPPPPSRASS